MKEKKLIALVIFLYEKWKKKKKENEEMEDRIIKNWIIRDILTNVVKAR